ncbi:Endonuclease/exonuclease/phosphatase [Abortiporus biennis]|nr:Endonuclease/exonuclease/phosphatase [Abortiporus biennis]
MRILSWNINGIRTLPQYHPWNTTKNCEEILDKLEADIICFQEMKSSRSALPKDVALPGHYDSFFSFPLAKGGYSGVAVYTDSHKVVPLKAEEGLSGKLQPKPPLSSEERISPSYPSTVDMTLVPDEDGNTPVTFDSLDSEGRALVIDFGLFVLINLYCPNETSDARLPFKMNFHLLLQERVKKLMEGGREVIVLGDMNICATPMDHCDGHLPSNAKTFYEHPAREWFHNWLEPNGPMVDIVRSFWPDRKGLYTCNDLAAYRTVVVTNLRCVGWNTKISARETNYGTRVDYILVSRGLLQWIKYGDIQASLKGSDHCPIYIDLHEEIQLESGQTLKLKDAMHFSDDRREPPRLAAKFWEEFSGKQTLLSSFFKKGDGDMSARSTSTTPNRDTKPSIPLLQSSQTSATKTTTGEPSVARSKSSPISSTIKKRKPADASPAATASSKKRKVPSSQSSIASFFSVPSMSSKTKTKAKAKTSSQEPIDVDADFTTSCLGSDTPLLPSSQDPSEPDSLSQIDSDYQFALQLASAEEATLCEPSGSNSSSSSTSTPTSSQKDTKSAWSSLFTPIRPPKCTVHGEPAKKFTVNKPGPNKGRSFYVCSR